MQPPDDDRDSRLPQPVPPATLGRSWTSIEITLTVGILLFGLMALILETIIILRAPAQWPPTTIMRLFCVTLIIPAVLCLVTAGYSNQQVAPVVGLLGSIVGYLLGSGKDGGDSKSPT
jgi:hypothetical protein